VINLIKVSTKESEIANTLNSKRDKAYLDIYKETEFSGLGILIDNELNVYKYLWNIGFNKETHNFAVNNYLYKSRKKIKYEELENYLIKDLNIIENDYRNNSDEIEKYNEVIKLKPYVNEYYNKELYEKIIIKISEMIKEDL
jgi:hypothetical protein